MQLLVSVMSAAEASAALAGGADVIDAKDPRRGALGAVSPEALRQIRAAVDDGRLVTAALGDADDEATIERDARAFTAAGAALVKVGFAGVTDAGRIRALTAAAVRGADAGNGGVVAVAYADAVHAASLAPGALADVAARAGAAGLLIDTAEKGGAGLRALVPQRVLAAWVADGASRRADRRRRRPADRRRFTVRARRGRRHRRRARRGVRRRPHRPRVGRPGPHAARRV